VGREDDDRAFRHFRQLLDEDRALGLERAHDLEIVNDCAPHVDGGAVVVERVLDCADRATDARAKAARGDQDHLKPWKFVVFNYRRIGFAGRWWVKHYRPLEYTPPATAIGA
jgi:hypothetical protein